MIILGRLLDVGIPKLGDLCLRVFDQLVEKPPKTKRVRRCAIF